MKLRSVAPPWFNDDPDKQAKCVLFPASEEYDPWYVEEGKEDHTEDAKAICSGTYDGKPCPLINDCLNFALVNNERYGVWGGTSPEERVTIRKEKKIWQQSQQAGASQQDA